VDLHFGGAGRGWGGWAVLAMFGFLSLSGGPALAQAAQPAPAVAAAQIPDPWEKMNRGLFHFSMAVDHAVIAPVVHAYRAAMPAPVQVGIRNVVYNLDEPKTFANDMLQLRFHKAGETTIRFVANSTVGLGGLFDVAGATGLPGHDSDFGQTLGRWGAPTGPYLFVPFVASSDIRDGIGRLADAFGDPVSWAFGGLDTTFGQVHDGLRIFQARVDIDDQITGLNRDFTDPYVTLRSGFAQHRAFKVQEAQGVTTAAQVKDLPDFGAEPTPPAKP
jgi:phospholipid-binding lipoprotein MlaA